MTTPAETDTGGLPLSEDTGLDAPVTPEEEAPETVEEPTLETGNETEPAETEDADEQSLFEEYDLQELAKTDPALKALWKKAQDWGRSQADDAYKQRIEHEKTEAQRQAQEEALSAEYTKAVENAREVLGGKAANDLDALLRHVAENGMPDGFDPRRFAAQMATNMFSGTNVAIAMQLADDRAKALAEKYPGYEFSPETVREWTVGLQKRDPAVMDQAYLRAIDEAARAAITAEQKQEADTAKAKADAETAKAKELRSVEDTRNSQARPTRDVPAAGGRLTTPEDLEKMSSNDWRRLSQDEQSKLLNEAQRVEERRRQRGRVSA